MAVNSVGLHRPVTAKRAGCPRDLWAVAHKALYGKRLVTIAAATTNEVTRVLCPFSLPVLTVRHHQLITCSRSHTGELGSPPAPPHTCLPAQGGGPEPHGPKRGTYAPQKGSREPGACQVSTGAGGGIVLALVMGTRVKVRVQSTGDLGLQEDASR